VKITTTFFSKKFSIWLLNLRWLWISTKVPFTTWCSMDIDKTVTYYKGYKHFIFRGCVACNKFTDDKDTVLKGWFIYNAKELLEIYKKQQNDDERNKI
jgi:hypothetical protein